ncbi:GlxA family transcriptional regulator [Salininema proteolyticum]|uniref:GlxA family transcriptional regulator n=1 Tax=Salininema proteolyticum TaxID=1607685 RepID=A0ABV8U2R1_9ACTN
MSPHRVAVLALDNVVPFDLGIPDRVFSAATPSGKPLYTVETCGLGGAPIAAGGLTLHPAHDENLLAEADTVILATTHTSPDGLQPPTAPPGLADALGQIRPGARIVSFCSAALLLAEIGLLNGCRATTHWVLTDHLRRYPDITVVEDVLYVDEGDILTSAGAAAAIDLCLHLIRRDHGGEIANQAARRCVVSPWREGGQAQFIDQPVPLHTDTSTAPTRQWLLQTLAQRHTVDGMADNAHMSRRTFTRRFRDETGTSPLQWLQRQRIERARELLESTDLSVDRVAVDVGFGTGTALRQRFRTDIGISPTAYRSRFRHQALIRQPQVVLERLTYYRRSTVRTIDEYRKCQAEYFDLALPAHSCESVSKAEPHPKEIPGIRSVDVAFRLREGRRQQ